MVQAQARSEPLGPMSFEAFLAWHPEDGRRFDWMLDFRSLGAVRHIGQPKQPTISVCILENGEYCVRRFVAGQQLESMVFPELQLSVEAVFATGGSAI